MANVTYSKGDCGKCNYGISIMANETEPLKLCSLYCRSQDTQLLNDKLVVLPEIPKN